MSSATESFDVTTADGRVMRITIDRRELASTMLFRLNKTRSSFTGKRTQPQKVVALEGGVKAEWVAS
jgi:hypothetical protein